jgi:hypothetical protein
VYYFLTEAAVNRFILELRRYWQYHPKYRDELVKNIQGKYSFDTRPQHGIIVKMGSASRTRLSADNYVGTTQSYAYHQKVYQFPGTSVEWTREDGRAIQANGGEFPSPPGIYYVTITDHDLQTGILTFEIESLLTVYDEIVTSLGPTMASLQNPYVPGSLRLYWMPSGTPLTEGESYTGTPETGEIELITPLAEGTWLTADYRFDGGTTGPFTVQENHAHNLALPGVVIAFGRRGFEGDRFAVTVSERREPAYLLYGGRWEMSLDFDVLSRDPYAQREITDATIHHIMTALRTVLCDDGIEIAEVSPGGESEEAYDDNADDLFYNTNFSVSMHTDWFMQVPIVGHLQAVLPLGYDDFAATAQLTDEEVARVQTNIQAVESLGLQSFRDPFFRGRNATFEMIR